MSLWHRAHAAEPTYPFRAAGDAFRVATELFCRLGSVAANTDHGRQNPANTDPKKMTPTREGKTEEVDAHQHVRGALTSSLDEPSRRKFTEEPL
jgi:hypothetical protein